MRLGLGLWLGSSSASYSPVVARPTITGTVYTVSTSDSDAAIKAVYDACSSGDCLEFASGTYNPDLIFTSGFNKAGVTIRAASIGSYDADPWGNSSGQHWARFTRNVIWEWTSVGGHATTVTPNSVTAADVCIHDISQRLASGLWPADGSNWTSTLGANYYARCGFFVPKSGAARFKLLYCEASTGYGTNYDPYDTSISNVYYDYAGEANRLLDGPVLVDGRYYAGESITLYGNYFHDITGGFSNIMPSSGTLRIQHNWGARFYQDYCNMLGQTTATGVPDLIIFDQNYGEDPFADSADTGNPHQDFDQAQWQHTNSGNPFYVKIQAQRNFLFVHETTRGTGAQFNFHPLVSAGNVSTVKPISRAPKYRENVAVMSGTSHGLDTGVCEHAYIRGNVAVHLPGWDGTATQALVTWSKGNAGVTAGANVNYYGLNVFEKVPVGTTVNISESTYHIGLNSSRTIADSAIFTGDLTSYPANAGTAFPALKTKGIYTTAGHTATTLREFMLAPFDWTGEAVHAAFVPLINQTPSSTITSELTWLHGGDTGDSLAVVPGAGVEMQSVLASDRTTVVQAWTTGSFNAEVDNHLLQIRGDSAAQNGGNTYTYTVGGESFSWSVVSTADAYPVATFDATGNTSQPSAAAGGADSQYVTFGLDIGIAGAPASAANIWGAVSGTMDFRIQVLTGRQIRIIITNSSGGTISTITSSFTLPADGTMHRILGSIDLSRPSTDAAYERVVLYKDGTLDTGLTVSGWSQGTSINFGKSSIRRKLGGAHAFTFGFLYIQPGVVLDLSDGVQASKFNDASAGSDGSNISGTQPPFFLRGDATKLNSATETNYGSVNMTFGAATIS